MNEILFLCTGNTCRSPMAEAIAADRFGAAFRFSSRGVSVFTPSGASANAQRAAEAEFGLSLAGHTSCGLEEADLQRADLVLTMTRAHKNYVIQAYPVYAEKCFTLCGYAGAEDKDVVDPYGQSVDVYRACARELYHYIEKLPLRQGLEGIDSDAGNCI